MSSNFLGAPSRSGKVISNRERSELIKQPRDYITSLKIEAEIVLSVLLALLVPMQPAE